MVEYQHVSQYLYRDNLYVGFCPEMKGLVDIKNLIVDFVMCRPIFLSIGLGPLLY